eukprot:TRINITY_DN17056_c0_g1_i1.p1 TRINITY_DN17056_c0_g1~~TRINITY_DN17056_c0_g1_i1.p1  ORF type:complete len:268 (+),score=72.39 TRINITY_DN17056_c0_g1_i1:95-805(+)
MQVTLRQACLACGVLAALAAAFFALPDGYIDRGGWRKSAGAPLAAAGAGAAPADAAADPAGAAAAEQPGVRDTVPPGESNTSEAAGAAGAADDSAPPWANISIPLNVTEVTFQDDDGDTSRIAVGAAPRRLEWFANGQARGEALSRLHYSDDVVWVPRSRRLFAKLAAERRADRERIAATIAALAERAGVPFVRLPSAVGAGVAWLPTTPVPAPTPAPPAAAAAQQHPPRKMRRRR